jgi:hypothetical protein
MEYDLGAILKCCPWFEDEELDPNDTARKLASNLRKQGAEFGDLAKEVEDYFNDAPLINEDEHDKAKDLVEKLRRACNDMLDIAWNYEVCADMILMASSMGRVAVGLGLGSCPIKISLESICATKYTEACYRQEMMITKWPFLPRLCPPPIVDLGV